MVFVSVELHSALYLHDLSVHVHVEVPLLEHTLEEFAVVSLPVSHQRGEDKDSLALIGGEYHSDNLFLGVSDHFFACHVAVGCAGSGVEQSQKIIDFGGGAHS